MAMTYSTLTGSKTAPGSIILWTSYTKLDVLTVVDEAQSLLYRLLRCREMRTEFTFGMPVGNANIALPIRFLDPIGKVFDLTNNTEYSHSIETSVIRRRSYDTSLAGSFGNNPFTTTAGSTLVAAAMTAHGINQDSTVTILGATAVDGLTLNGSFPVVSITDANNFVFDCGATPTAGGITGGGAAATWTANNLVAGSPSIWSVWDEQIKFDTAFDTSRVCKLLYYRQPALLSANNTSNFITNRYPMLMRVACLAAAANFMKDDTEYQKQVTALMSAIGEVAAQDDLIYRGAEFGTDTP